MEGPSPRIVKETKTLTTDPVPGIAFTPDPNNYKHFLIELQGIYSSMKDLPERATKEANSRQSCCYLMITPCLHPKSYSIQKFTTQT